MTDAPSLHWTAKMLEPTTTGRTMYEARVQRWAGKRQDDMYPLTVGKARYPITPGEILPELDAIRHVLYKVSLAQCVSASRTPS